MISMISRIIGARGSIYDKQNQVKKAKDIYKQAIQYGSVDPLVYNNLGTIYQRQAIDMRNSVDKEMRKVKIEKAVNSYMKAIKYDPSGFLGYHNL